MNVSKHLKFSFVASKLADFRQGAAVPSAEDLATSGAVEKRAPRAIETKACAETQASGVTRASGAEVNTNDKLPLSNENRSNADQRQKEDGHPETDSSSIKLTESESQALLTQDVQYILSQFEAAWTFDLADLRKPSAEVVIEKLIQGREPSRHARLRQEFFGAGPLEDLINDSRVTEILVNGPSEIWFERSGQLTRAMDTFTFEITYRGFVDRLCREASVKVDLATPFANGRWGEFRLHLATAPLANVSFHISLRRTSTSDWTLERLTSAGWCDAESLQRLRELLSTRKNVLVVGPTGCGKTTVLGACLRELSCDERVVVIEDTDELQCPNGASTKLLSRPSLSAELPEIGLGELVRQSLRMRPSRLVVGEVRGAEAKDLLLALATGHSGSWGTLHASDARQALLRLEMLIQLGAPQWSLEAIRQLLHLSVDAIVVCEIENGMRRLGGIYRIAALEKFGFLLESVS